MRKFLTSASLIVFLNNLSIAQIIPKTNLQSPLEIPLYLSGNFGELRTGHFHAGLDIKTMGEIGLPIYASQEGYVSRIKIQSGGYGRSIYITHPKNGYTIVYAHLDRFIPTIESYIKKNQYEKQCYEVDLIPPKELIVIKKRQLIAYSGNTGNSGGPHVHLEIRKTHGDVSVNGLKFGLPIADNQRPEFRNLFIYSMPGISSIGGSYEKRNQYSVVKQDDSTYLIKSILESSFDYLGIAAEVYDYLDGSSNECGVYSLELTIDKSPVFSFRIDEISYSQTDYVNAHMDYELKVLEDKSVHRFFKLPNNKLPIYNCSLENGVYHFVDDTIHMAEIKAFDTYGNNSVLRFRFKRSFDTASIDTTKLSDNYIKWNRGKSFQFGNTRINIPSNALYRDIYFNFLKKKGGLNDLSDTFYIHDAGEPLHKNIAIQLRLDSIDQSIVNKLLFVRLDKENKISAEGGEWLDGKLITFTKNFGKYFVMADTIPPTITPGNFVNNKQYYNGQQLTFLIFDDVSGIKSYNAYINDKWALLEYDSKSDTVTYSIDKERLEPGKIYKLKIFVLDDKNNVAVFEGQFKF
jgi:murein DD-endopeptidase MepM/ murein hydrolase activator NlpD